MDAVQGESNSCAFCGSPFLLFNLQTHRCLQPSAEDLVVRTLGSHEGGSGFNSRYKKLLIGNIYVLLAIPSSIGSTGVVSGHRRKL